MNETLKAVIVEVSGGHMRKHHVNFRGTFGLFPDDCPGGSNVSTEGTPIRLHVGGEAVDTDIDEGKAIFRERGAFRRFFASERVVEGDLLLTQRLGERESSLSKASKRGFKYYL